MQILRVLIASFGGYLFASLMTVSLSFILPFSNKAESVLLSTMVSFIFWLGFIIYSFSGIDIKKLSIQATLVCLLLYAINYYFLVLKG